ncbi:MAG: PucR family transcriptional regulator ligand-binding domain-containing protein [Chloroflexi bacterium]|nr:PucR family transcriptional regulator ligand-binding domain-containing protein [Chloroflexota bacterium]
MLTVADALRLEQFAEARVVAGRDGLHKRVAWVHIASGPDAPHWLNGGELVLTTVRNLPPEPADQCRYIEEMADKGVAALAVSVGRFLEVTPDFLREVADRRQFPLIEIPFQARFVDIAKATNEHIAEETMALVKRAFDIQQKLTQLVLEGGDLNDLADRLAELIGQSISIENERFEILASHNVAEVDEARRFTVSEGHTDPRLVEALETRGILAQLRATLRPVHIPPMPDVGLELERFLAPIVVHGDVYGYVWIIPHGQPLTDIDRMAIDSGATIAALMLLYQESLQSAEASLKGGLLSQLIQGESGREVVLTDQALRYGVDLRRPFVMLLVEQADGSSRIHQVYRRVNRLASLHRWSAVVGQFAGQVVILAQADETVPTIADQIQTEFQTPLRIGVSGTSRGAGTVSAAYQQCREVLLITGRLGNPQPVVYFDHLGYLHALYRAGADALATNPYAPPVRRLLAEGQTDLFTTLEAYLDAGGNGVQTAETLHIHRSTLNYRLERIREICGFDLSDPIERTNLQVALKLLRLFEVE